MVSPFGGDGGDIIVDPTTAARSSTSTSPRLWSTTNCGQTDGSESAIFDVGVPDPNPRFTAPFRIGGAPRTPWTATASDGSRAATRCGRTTKAFAYTEEEAEEDASHGWRKIADLGTAGRMTVGLDAIADPAAPADPSKDVVYAAWCGEANCNTALDRPVHQRRRYELRRHLA